MDQIFIIHRVFINAFAYCGLMLGIDQEILNSNMIGALGISPILSNLIVLLGIIMWIIKGVWFVYDHFFLERSERLKKLNDE
jgi:hypothetical protein